MNRFGWFGRFLRLCFGYRWQRRKYRFHPGNQIRQRNVALDLDIWGRNPDHLLLRFWFRRCRDHGLLRQLRSPRPWKLAYLFQGLYLRWFFTKIIDDDFVRFWLD